MSDIGKYLRNWFEKNQISIYQAAKESNINRTTLQKVLSGDRTPSRHLVTSLVSALPFSVGEVREIWDLFESDQSGMGTYMQNQYIDRMMKNISFISADNVAVPVQSEKSDGKEQLLLYRTPYEVEELLKELLKEEMEKKNSFPFGRSVLIHAPAENEMFHSIFNVIYMSPEAKLLKISHLTRLYKNQSGQTQSVENLKALANILPFFSTHRLNYQVGYYYSSGASEDLTHTAFPYYIIFSQAALLISDDCCSAVLCREKSLIEYLKKMFERTKHISTQMITSFHNSMEILHYYMRTTEGGFKTYWLENQPCMVCFFDQRLVEKYTRTGIPDREALMELVLKRSNQLKEFHNFICMFTESGLESFVKTGRLIELPEHLAEAFNLSDRLFLVEELYRACEQDKGIFRIATPLMFRFPIDIVHSLRVGGGFEFGGFDPADNQYHYIIIDEPTMLAAFTEYYQSLVDSPMLYSKEKTLEIIQKYRNDLEREIQLAGREEGVNIIHLKDAPGKGQKAN